jgi:hypothetical protein
VKPYETSEKRYNAYAHWVSVLSFGFFVITFGIVWWITPNFFDAIVDFFNSFQLVKVTGNVSFPTPTGDNSVLYNALMWLCILVGVFQIAILALRFIFHDTLNRKAQTISNVAFLFGATFFLSMLATETISWLGFIAGFIICAGLSIIVSNIVKLFRKA